MLAYADLFSRDSDIVSQSCRVGAGRGDLTAVFGPVYLD